MQTLLLFLPIIVSAACIPVLMRRAGHGRGAALLGLLPAIVATFGLAAVLAGERAALDGPFGLWTLAAFLAFLSFGRPADAPATRSKETD